MHSAKFNTEGRKNSKSQVQNLQLLNHSNIGENLKLQQVIDQQRMKINLMQKNNSELKEQNRLLINQYMENTFTKENSVAQFDCDKIFELTGKLKALESINDKFQQERILMLQYINQLEGKDPDKLLDAMKMLESENIRLLQQNKELLKALESNSIPISMNELKEKLLNIQSKIDILDMEEPKYSKRTRKQNLQNSMHFGNLHTFIQKLDFQMETSEKQIDFRDYLNFMEKSSDYHALARQMVGNPSVIFHDQDLEIRLQFQKEEQTFKFELVFMNQQ